MITSSVLIATTIVIAALGIASGGTIPTFLMAAQVMASVVAGGVRIGAALYDKKGNEYKVQHLDDQADRKHHFSRSHDYMLRIRQSDEEVAHLRKQMHAVEKTRQKAIQGVFR